MVVRIDRVVTRGGDGGETSLGDGSRVGKDDLRIAAIGAVDEANAVMGILRLHTGGFTEVDAMLARIQNDLFDIGADLCVPGEAGARLRVGEGMLARLDSEILEMNAGLAALTSFVLPGGSAGEAYAHLARTTLRRAEREVVGLAVAVPGAVNPVVVQALNRLSDHLFVMGRVLNSLSGCEDVLWVPGGKSEI